MENERLKELLFVGAMGAALIAGHFSLKHICQIDQQHEESARYIAMQYYKPVGNGGALAEMNGRISPERQDMYKRINDTYLLNMKWVAPSKVIAEYRVLTDSNLTENEREELNRIINYLSGFKKLWIDKKIF